MIPTLPIGSSSGQQGAINQPLQQTMQLIPKHMAPRNIRRRKPKTEKQITIMTLVVEVVVIAALLIALNS